MTVVLIHGNPETPEVWNPRSSERREHATDALRGGQHLRRAELLGLWAAAGLDAVGSRATHLLRYLAQTGTVCFRPRPRR